MVMRMIISWFFTLVDANLILTASIGAKARADEEKGDGNRKPLKRVRIVRCHFERLYLF